LPDFYAAGALIAYMLADHEITRDELFAFGATFTLVAWAFAYSYVVIQAIEPGSFTAAVDPSAQRSWMELLFLSFTNLTSTGLSDVAPVKPFARGFVMIEQLAGLAYVAILVSRLVALTVLRRSGGLSGVRAGPPQREMVSARRTSTCRTRSSDASSRSPVRRRLTRTVSFSRFPAARAARCADARRSTPCARPTVPARPRCPRRAGR
jgi:hypothetical protein